MLMKLEQSTPEILGFLASGRLTDNDYKNFLIPEVKSALDASGQIRLLFQLDGFRGWDIQAAWDDLIFGMEINSKVDKIAIVGDSRWEQWVARLVKAFTHGEARHFTLGHVDEAWDWVRG